MTSKLIVGLYLLLAPHSAGASPVAAGPQPVAFSASLAPPAPDYAKPSSWAAGIAGPGAAAHRPANATALARHAAVDVFYIHPTTDLSAEHWNQDIADAKTNAWTDASVIARQASVFNGCCRIFAPRYRQASHLALTHYTDAQGEGAFYGIAYGDVERAFDYYIAHYNHGRPFILAGHSQGGADVARLLARRIDGTRLQKRMVVAYDIGFNLSEGDFPRTYKSLAVCATPAQTGCVVAWNSILASADLGKAAHSAEQRYIAKYGDDAGKTTLCVNPLTFDRARPSAGIDDSKGAVPGDPSAGDLQPLRNHAVSARCEKGFLVVEPDAALGLAPLPGGSMHYHDYGLFYADIRANALLRIAAFQRAQNGR